MNPALWGSLSAVSLGTADFAARFSTRALRADTVYLAVLATGSVILTLWVLFTDVPLVWSWESSWLLLVSGVFTALMSMLLYTGLARGPVSVVAPIVAANPVLVVLFWVALGTTPTGVQWVAMAGVIVGAVLVARAGRSIGDVGSRSPRAFRLTLLIAIAACITHAIMVIAGQVAVPIYGDVQTLWIGRVVGLVFMLALFVGRRTMPRIPIKWWPLLITQGCLDAGGYLFLFAGSHGEGREIAAVAASAFGAITVLLAFVFLRERIRAVQWLGVALVFACIGVLSSH